MPFYTVHCNPGTHKKREWFGEKLAHLHAKTFGTDWRAVRVEFVISTMDSGIRRYGGHNFKDTSGGFFGGLAISSEYIVAHVNFKDCPEVWQDYCRKVVHLYGDPNMSIYLQKLEMEFELGSLVPATSLEKKPLPTAPSSSAPPAYDEQMKETG